MIVIRLEALVGKQRIVDHPTLLQGRAELQQVLVALRLFSSKGPRDVVRIRLLLARAGRKFDGGVVLLKLVAHERRRKALLVKRPADVLDQALLVVEVLELLQPVQHVLDGDLYALLSDVVHLGGHVRQTELLLAAVVVVNCRGQQGFEFAVHDAHVLVILFDQVHVLQQRVVDPVPIDQHEAFIGLL